LDAYGDFSELLGRLERQKNATADLKMQKKLTECRAESEQDLQAPKTKKAKGFARARMSQHLMHRISSEDEKFR